MLLVLPLYLILFFICWRFQPLIKIMADVGYILNDDDFFGDIVDTLKEGIGQHKKRERLKSVKDKGKLMHKWTHERVDKASDEIIYKTYAEYKQRELNEKVEKTEKALGKHAINFYSTGISQMVKVRADLGCLLVCTLGNLLAPVLVFAHTIINLDLGNENEAYESY